MKTLARTKFPAKTAASDPVVERYTHLVRQALPVMENIAGETGLAVSMGAMLEKERCGVILAHILSARNISFHLPVGARFFLHTSAPGKALMAGLPPARLKTLISGLRLEQFNDRTITDKKKLMNVIREVRKKGYGWDLAERFDGSHCVGISLLSQDGEPLAAIWVHGPSLLVPEDRFPGLAAVLHKWIDGRVWTLTPLKRTDSEASVIAMINKAVKLMEAGISANVDLEAFAASQHVSYTWFRRVFKRTTGISPHQYQVSMRMKQAEAMLRGTRLKVVEISARLGFESPYYFSHLFKIKHGCSPLVYREKGDSAKKSI